jgi:hypothetical protein
MLVNLLKRFLTHVREDHFLETANFSMNLLVTFASPP